MGGDEKVAAGHPSYCPDAIHLALLSVDDGVSCSVRPGAGSAFELSASPFVWVHEGDREAGRRVGVAAGDDGGAVFVGEICPAKAGTGRAVEEVKKVTEGAGADPGKGGGGGHAERKEPPGDRVCVPGAWDEVSGTGPVEAGAAGAPGGERDLPGDFGGGASGGMVLGD